MKRLLSVLLALCVLFALIPCMPLPAAAAEEIAAYDAEHPEKLVPAHLSGSACIAMDAATGEVLFDKNADKRMYPASTTKIMTLLVALDKGPSLDTMVTIPPEAAKIPSDSSKIPVKPGEVMTFADLLYSFMLMSGNDGANAVAVIVSGSIPAFVEEMNAYAQRLGCVNTHFVNAHGYQDASHYTTARDLALMAREGLKSDIFRSIVACKEYTMAPTSVRDKLTLSTKNSMFVATSKYYYAPLIGVKTGRTSSAGYCFVGASKSGSAEVITVTLKTTEPGRWTDTKKLAEYAFTKYTTFSFEDLYTLSPLCAVIEGASEEDENGGIMTMSVVPGSSIFDYTVAALPSALATLSQDFQSSLEVTWSRERTAPVTAGDIMGTVSVKQGDMVLTGMLVADRDVAEQRQAFSLYTLFPALKDADLSLFRALLLIALALIALVIILRIRRRIRINRRRRRMIRRRRKAYQQYRNQMRR